MRDDIVGNEFAEVAVSIDCDANSRRLRVEDLKTGRVRFLDALELETLVWLPIGTCGSCSTPPPTAGGRTSHDDDHRSGARPHRGTRRRTRRAVIPDRPEARNAIAMEVEARLAHLGGERAGTGIGRFTGRRQGET